MSPARAETWGRSLARGEALSRRRAGLRSLPQKLYVLCSVAFGPLAPGWKGAWREAVLLPASEPEVKIMQNFQALGNLLPEPYFLRYQWAED